MSIKITPKMFAMLDSNAQSAINSLFLAKPLPLAEVKPKRVLSSEHLAKLKAGREAKQALKRLAKLAAAEDAALPESIPLVETVAVTVPEPVEQKKRGPKPLATKTPEELAAHKAKVAERKAKKEMKKLAEALAEPVLPEAVPVPEPVAVAEPVLPEPVPLAEPKPTEPKPTEPKPTEGKPKRTLSPEHLAKLKAGREAAKAKKLASTEVTVTVTSPEVPRPSIEIPEESIMPEEPVPVAPVVEEKKRRGPKKLADMTPEELVAHRLKVEERKAAKVTFREPLLDTEPVQIKFKTA
jgi:hypothetical protein